MLVSTRKKIYRSFTSSSSLAFFGMLRHIPQIGLPAEFLSRNAARRDQILSHRPVLSAVIPVVANTPEIPFPEIEPPRTFNLQIQDIQRILGPGQLQDSFGAIFSGHQCQRGWDKEQALGLRAARQCAHLDTQGSKRLRSTSTKSSGRA